MKFLTWCAKKADKEGHHDIVVLSGAADKTQVGVDNCAAAIPSHYSNPAFAVLLLKKLGKPKAAAYLEGKLPTSKTLRSGDLGEILATSYVAENSNYEHFIKRLRFKDHRHMAMRGDDLIAARENPASKEMEFLKAEVKSRVSLTSAVLSEARTALRGDNNRPSPHALAFVAERLAEDPSLARNGFETAASAIESAVAKLSRAINPERQGLLRVTAEQQPNVRLDYYGPNDLFAHEPDEWEKLLG